MKHNSGLSFDGLMDFCGYGGHTGKIVKVLLGIAAATGLGAYAANKTGLKDAIDYYRRWKGLMKEWKEIHGPTLRQYTDDELTQDQFLDCMQSLEEQAMDLAAFTTPLLTEYETYCRERFGYFPEQFIDEWIINHEHEHAIVAERYGLQATYGMFAVGKIPLQPFLMDHLSEDARGWDKERLLDYLRETSEELSDPSEGDQLVRDTLGVKKENKP